MKTGDPRGIIHEPYIDLVFVNDISTCISHSHLKLYADNMGFISVDENRDNLEHLVLYFLMVS